MPKQIQFQKEKLRTFKNSQNPTDRYGNYLNGTYLNQLITLHQNALIKVILMTNIMSNYLRLV